METERDNRIRRLRNTTIIQGIMAAGGFGLYLLTGNPALKASAIHDTNDLAMHGSKLGAEKRGWNQDSWKFKLFLRGSMGLLSLLAVESAVDNAEAIITEGAPSQTPAESAALAGVGVAVAYGNRKAFEQMQGVGSHSLASQSSLDHARFDSYASNGFAAGLILEAAGVPGASLWGGYTFGVYTAFEAGHHAIEPYGDHEH